MSKRSRSSLGRYDDSSDERLTPEKDRRSRGRSPGPSPSRGRYPPEPSHRDDYPRRERPYTSGYKVLCVSALHPKASDDVVRDTLYREFKKYGEISVKVVHEPEERVAYVYFRSYEDARDAKHSKSRIILFDKPVIVEAAYESQSVSRGSDVYSSRSARPRSITPEYDRYSYRARSPGPDRHRPDDRYNSYGGPPPPPPQHRDFRREGPMHNEFIPRGPPHHGGPPGPHGFGGPRGYKNFDKMESKRDKFPNYLHHVPPEDDPLATRTLFAGNLEINISDEELRRIFSRYGVVEDIDIKRPPPGTGNAYAFVRYQNLDMAHRAKVELSGQYVGKFQCKIGYGKVTPTTRIWVGGLGPWTSLPQLEREFDRFGAIKKIDYAKGDNCAYILYDSIDAAQAAVKEMRGFPLGGPDRRLRADFSDVTPPGGYPAGFKARPYEEGGEFHHPRENYSAGYEGNRYENWGEEYNSSYSGGGGGGGGYRGRGSWNDRRGGGRGGPRYRPPFGEPPHEDWVGKRSADGDGDGAPPRQLRRTSRTPEPGEDRSSRSPRHHSIESDAMSDKEGGRRNGVLSGARNLGDIARKSEVSWQGALILKNSLFPTKLHMTDGDSDVVETLLKDEEGKPHLRITQRLRLDPPKLEDVSKRISSSTSHAIFVALSGSASAVTLDDASVQSRPLRNLVSYLKQKEAAGVISLQNKETETTGVLYAFPPCPFSSELLRRTAGSLSEEGLKEDHLVIVVVKGGTA